MSPPEPGWLTGLEGTRLSSKAARFVGFQVPVRPWERAEQVPAGTWWMEALGWLSGADLAGPLLWGPEPWPVAVVSGGEATLVSSSARTLLPMSVFRTAIAAGDAHWGERLEGFEEVRDELAVLHRCLGGADELAALQSVLQDEALRERASAGGVEGERALAEIATRLDPDPGHVAYRRFLQSAIEGPVEWRDEPRWGPWAGSAASAAFAAALREGELDSVPPGLCWALCCWPACIGLCHEDWPEHVDVPGGGLSVEPLVQAAERLGSTEPDTAWTTDPRWRASRALAEQGATYDGSAHAEAARQLADAGRSRAAWGTFLSATFWRQQHRGEGALEDLEEGIELARELSFDALAASIERVRTAAEEA